MQYPSSPPLPPPKPGSGTHTPSQGPPLPPPPQDAAQTSQHGHQQSAPVAQAQLDPGWLPPGLVDKSVQDLHELLENPNLQASYLDNKATSHASITDAQRPLEELLTTNVALCQSLLQLEAQVSAQRDATQSRLLALRALEQQHRSKVADTEKELLPFSPPTLYQKLSASVIEQNALLKGIEDSFLEENSMASDREVQDFIKRVRDAKRVAFLRNERKMRWDEARVGGWR